MLDITETGINHQVQTEDKQEETFDLSMFNSNLDQLSNQSILCFSRFEGFDLNTQQSKMEARTLIEEFKAKIDCLSAQILLTSEPPTQRLQKSAEKGLGSTPRQENGSVQEFEGLGQKSGKNQGKYGVGKTEGNELRLVQQHLQTILALTEEPKEGQDLTEIMSKVANLALEAQQMLKNQEEFQHSKSPESAKKIEEPSKVDSQPIKTPKRRIKRVPQIKIKPQHRDKSTQATPAKTPLPSTTDDEIFQEIECIPSIKHKLKIKIEKIYQNYSESRRGHTKSVTLLAMRDTEHYMLGNHSNGLQTFQGDEIVSKLKLPGMLKTIKDMIFIKSEGFYVIAQNKKIYKKRVGFRSLEEPLTVKSGFRHGACLRYSELNRRLIISQNCKNISAVNLQTNQIEFMVEKSGIDKIMDFRIFGKLEDRVVSITEEGYLFLYQMDYQRRRGEIIECTRIELMSERSEAGISLAVCNRHQYIMVEVGQLNYPWNCSRMLVFEVQGRKMVQKAMLDQFNEIGHKSHKSALICYRSLRNYVIWVGLSRGDDGVAQVFYYNKKSENFEEFKDLRVRHMEVDPVRLHRMSDGRFYYTGKDGALMRLSFQKDFESLSSLGSKMKGSLRPELSI